MNGVVVDWVTKNIYWADGQYNVIGVVQSAGSLPVWKAIVNSNLNSPQDVVVNPLLR